MVIQSGTLICFHAFFSASKAVLLPIQTTPVKLCIFIFQAEDGIRAGHVTGVQTCALPIFMEAAFNERWIDYSNNIGKQSGAFCSSPYGSNSFILLTWTDMMRGTFTLAHELGHAGHFQLANRNQTILNTNVSTYFVEAPSTLNELLLAEHMLKQSNNDRMRAFVINNLLDTYYHNFVTHMLEAEFQYRIYKLAEEGIPLTADLLTKQKYEAITNFWGDDVDVPESAGLIWMRQPHYYMGLYPYTYSAGLTISTASNERIKEEG